MITAHAALFGIKVPAAIVESGVAPIANLIVEPNREIADLLIFRIGERLVLRDLFVRIVRLSDDRAVLDAPEIRIARPAGKILAVKDRLKAVV